MLGDVTTAEAPAFMNERPPADAWKACYRELAPKLLLFARQWCAEPADAEDVVQTAFVKFWRRQPDAQREHYPLLFAAVRSTALDHLRGHERRVRREAEPAVAVLREDAAFFDTTVEQREDAALLEGALRSLPPEQREVVVLRAWGGLTFSEIAQTLGDSINTVAARHRYALEALRRQLKPYAHERF
jgi:RNA polymerase sigma-70 factor (ECF subfamily)